MSEKLSFEEVRDFLLETDAISEAEAILLKNTLKKQVNEEKRRQDEAKEQERIKLGLPKEDKLNAIKIADLLSHIEDDLDANNTTLPDRKTDKKSISTHNTASTMVLTSLDEKDLQAMSLENFESLAQDELWKLEKLKLSVQRNLEDKRIQHQHIIELQHEKDFKGNITSSQWKAKQYMKEVDKSTDLQRQLVALSTQHHDKMMIKQRDILSAKYDLELLQSALYEQGSTAANEVVNRLARLKAKTGLQASEDDLSSPSKRPTDISAQYLKRDIAMELDHKSRVERILQQVQDDRYVQEKQQEIQQLRNVQQERLKYEQVSTAPAANNLKSSSGGSSKFVPAASNSLPGPAVPSSSSAAFNRNLPVTDLLDKFLKEESNTVNIANSNTVKSQPVPLQSKPTPIVPQSDDVPELSVNSVQEVPSSSSVNQVRVPSVEAEREEASDFLRLPRRRDPAPEYSRTTDHNAATSSLNAFRGYPNQGYPPQQQYPIAAQQPYGMMHNPAMAAAAGYGQPNFMQPQPGMFPGSNYPAYVPSGMPSFTNPYQPFPSMQTAAPFGAPQNHNMLPGNDPVALQLYKLTQQIEQENMQMQQFQGGGRPNGGMVPALQRGIGMADHLLPSNETPSMPGGQPQPAMYGLERDKQNQSENRLNREEVKRQEEIRKIQHELEKLKCQKELEEFKVDYDKQRITRQKELEYNLWLEDQKRELQAVKMKQILAKEQRLLQLQDMETSNLQTNSNQPVNNNYNGGDVKGPDAAGSWMRMKEECGVGNQALIALSMTALGLECNVKGVSVVLDAIFTSKSFLSEALAALPDNKVPSTAVVIRAPMIRVALGIYDASGKSVVRLIASEWQPWQETPANPSNWLLQTIQPLIHRSWKFMQSGLNNDNNAGNTNAKFEDIRRSIAGSKCLMELQYKDSNDASMNQKSLGWAVFPLFDPQLITSKASSTAGNASTSTIVLLSNNTWKVKLRKGLSDPTANPFDENNTMTSESYFLIRIFDSNELLRATAWNIPSSGLKYDELPSLYQDAFASNANPGATQELTNLRKSAEKKAASPLPINSPLRPPSSLNKAFQSPAVPAPTPVDPFSIKSVRPATGLQPAGPLPLLNTVPEDDDDHVLHPPSPRNNNSMYWQLGNVLGPCTERYQRGDGVDIYIDGARFLPDNCTTTRISLRMFTSNKEQVGSVYEAMANYTSSCISPAFKMKAECRGTVFNPTTVALIRIDTIDSVNLLPVSVGYACLKLFATRDRLQPTQSNEANVYINTGCFQIPIYGGRFSPATMESFNEDMLKTMRRIPCASLLIRVFAAPKSSDGISTLSRDEFPKDDWIRLKLDIPAPEYTSGAYSGAACEPTALETIAFEAKQIVSVTSSSNSITNGLTTMMPGSNMNNSVSLTIEAAINQGMQVNKSHTLPSKPNSSQETALDAWYKSMFPPLDQVRRSVDFTLCAPYSVESGMSLRIKGLYNLPEPGLFSGGSTYLYKVIASLSPPALYYNDPPLYDGIYWTKTHDFEKSAKAPEFLDGFITLTPAEMSFSLYLILDIRMIKVDPPTNKKDINNPNINVEPPSSRKSFWTLLPLSRERCSGQGFRYLQSGFFQLPLIEGSVPTAPEVLKSLNPLREVKKRLASKEKGVAMKLSDGPSLLLYVHNPLLQELVLPDMEHPAAMPDNVVLQSLVDSAGDGITGTGLRLEKFQYTAPRYTMGGNTTTKAVKSLSQSLPKGLDTKELTRLVNTSFQNATGLPAST